MRSMRCPNGSPTMPAFFSVFRNAFATAYRGLLCFDCQQRVDRTVERPLLGLARTAAFGRKRPTATQSNIHERCRLRVQLFDHVSATIKDNRLLALAELSGIRAE